MCDGIDGRRCLVSVRICLPISALLVDRPMCASAPANGEAALLAQIHPQMYNSHRQNLDCAISTFAKRASLATKTHRRKWH